MERQGLERVAVTGVGLVTALGTGAEATFERLVRGERGFRELSLFDPSGARCRFAAEARGFASEARAPGEPELSRTDRMALAAAREALVQSSSGGASLGISVGGTAGAMFEAEGDILAAGAAEHGAARRLVEQPLATTAEALARATGGAERVATLCAACSSGALAIARALDWVRRGIVDRALAGGADGLCRMTFFGFDSLGVLDAEPCRPFDRSRRGMSLGEGAAFLVLESERTARARGARILGFVSGAACGAEAHHITHPEPSGRRAAELVTDALRSAGLSPADLDYVNAHGTGTAANDAMETRALGSALGAEARRIRVSSSKGQLGHTLGAAGAIEAAVTVLALERGVAPPTAGLRDPEDGALYHVMGAAERAPLRAALSCSFGFGGTGVVLALERAESAPRARAERPARVVVTGVAALGARGAGSGSHVLSYLDAGSQEAASGKVGPDALSELDPERTRRFDRVAAQSTRCGELALAGAGIEPRGAGLVLGTAFGNVERTVAFVRRLGRSPSPAEFPHLVLSAAAGNASIYLGLEGPALAVSDREAGAESALDAAVALIAAGQTRAMLAGAAEAFDPLVAALSSGPPGCRRTEGAALLVLEERRAATARGAPSPAEVEGPFALRDGAELPARVAHPRRPERALVVTGFLSDDHERRLLASAWRGSRIASVLGQAGFHEAVSALALAVAVQSVLAGRADEALAASSAGGTLWLTRFARAGGDQDGAEDPTCDR